MKPHFQLMLACCLIFVCSCSKDEPQSTGLDEKPATPPVVQKELPPLKNGNLKYHPPRQYQSVVVGTESVDFVYTISNEGEEPINITRVESGCVCIHETVEPKQIPPGGTSTITATYDTTKLSGVAEKIMTIHSDQQGIGPASLIVKVEATPIYEIEPKMTAWKKGDSPSRKTVTFSVTRDDPIKVTKVTSTNPKFKTEIEEVEPGKTYKIHLTPDSTQSNSLGMVRVETDCEVQAHARPLIYYSIK